MLSTIRSLGPVLAGRAASSKELPVEPLDSFVSSRPEWTPPGPSLGVGALAMVGAFASLTGCASMSGEGFSVEPDRLATVKVVAPAAAAKVDGPAKIVAALQEASRISLAPPAQPELAGKVEGKASEPCPTDLCQRVVRYDSHIEAASEKFQVDPNLIRGVIAQESQGNPKAGSPKGAKGLMQLMPATGRTLGVKNRTDPKQSIMGGTRYLSQQLEDNHGDVERALWAYNAGPANLAKGVKPAETRNYIQAVQEYARQFREFIR